MTHDELRALAHAQLAHGLIQLAVHFPDELATFGLEIPGALERAVTLAEQAIALAPTRADGYVALGRLLLCHDEPAAWHDAAEVLRHALSLDPEHDGAALALATCLRALGQPAEALALAEAVLHRGSGLAQPLLLRALCHLDLGEAEPARRDLERAVRLAPQAGLIALDAARAADQSGARAEADAWRERAKSLLGRTFDTAAASLRRG